MNIKDPLMDYKKKFNIAAKNFVIAKNNLINLSKSISGFIYNKAFTIFQFKKTLGLINWIKEVFDFPKNQMKNQWELHENSFYNDMFKEPINVENDSIISIP